MGELTFGKCSRCRATTITLRHWVSGSDIEIDPLPVREGNIIPMFDTGKCRLVPLKFIKEHRGEQMWQAHVTSCRALKGEAS